MSRMRGIQYAAAPRFHHRCLWNYWVVRRSLSSGGAARRSVEPCLLFEPRL